MTLITWLLGGILALGIIRLTLAIWTHRKIIQGNAMIDAQRMTWNQMCEDLVALCKDEEGGSDDV